MDSIGWDTMVGIIGVMVTVIIFLFTKMQKTENRLTIVETQMSSVLENIETRECNTHAERLMKLETIIETMQ